MTTSTIIFPDGWMNYKRDGSSAAAKKGKKAGGDGDEALEFGAGRQQKINAMLNALKPQDVEQKVAQGWDEETTQRNQEIASTYVRNTTLGMQHAAKVESVQLGLKWAAIEAIESEELKAKALELDANLVPPHRFPAGDSPPIEGFRAELDEE